MPVAPPSVRMWGSLTGELAWSESPVRLFFRDRFPNIRDVQREYRVSVGSLVLPGSDRHRGTMGAAFDWALRFRVCPEPDMGLALRGARLSRRLFRATVELGARLGLEPVAIEGGRKRLGILRFDGPGQPSTVDKETLLRGCWALALLTEIYRIGMPMPGSPLLELDLETVRAGDLLALAPADAVEEMTQLLGLADSALLPHLLKRQGLWAVGPTFEGSKLMSADADLIAAGLLLEIKTTLGDKRRDGGRRCSVHMETLHQLLGYVLLDFDDEFGIDSVGLYAARYGHLAVWGLASLLYRLAGRPVDLNSEREHFKNLLLNGRPLSERRSKS